MWDHGETGIPVAGPGAPWSRSSRSPSSPPRSACPPRPARPTSARPSSSATGCADLVPGDQGDLPAWRARRVARETIVLSVEAAGYVDLHVAHVAHKVRPPARPAGRGGDRAVHARGGRTPPPPGRRRPVLHHRHPAALAAGHQHRVRASSTSPTPSTSTPPSPPAPRRQRTSAPPRPSTCAGPPRSGTSPAASSPSTSTPPAPRRGGRRTVTRCRPTRRPAVAASQSADTASGTSATRTGRAEREREAWHAQAASGGDVRPPLRGRRHPGASLAGEFGRVENTRGPVHAEQIRQWCGNPDAQITVQPVIDLNEHIDVEAYEIRGRLREQTILTHPTCVFPWVHPTRPRPGARRARRRLRPPGALRRGPALLLVQRRPVVPAPSPGQDPRPLDLHRPGPRHLRVDQPARLPVPARPPRHPRRLPRPTPPPAGPLHPPPAAGPRHPATRSRHPAPDR